MLADLYARTCRLPLLMVFVLCVVAMLALPIALSIGTVDAVGDRTIDAAMKSAPIWLLILAGLVIPILEAIFWTFCFIEGAAAMARRPQWGAFVGVIAYGTVYHSSGDIRTILAASWVALVANISYLILRTRSRSLALSWVIGLRWAFVGFALLAYRGIL